MIAHVLPWNEWGRLGTKELPFLLNVARPEDIAALVVEDEGKIAARVYAAQLPHLEGLRIEPEHRNAGVTRAMAKLIVDTMRLGHTKRVLAGAADGDDTMLQFLARIGAERLPMQLFSVGMGS